MIMKFVKAAYELKKNGSGVHPSEFVAPHWQTASYHSKFTCQFILKSHDKLKVKVRGMEETTRGEHSRGVRTGPHCLESITTVSYLMGN